MKLSINQSLLNIALGFAANFTSPRIPYMNGFALISNGETLEVHTTNGTESFRATVPALISAHGRILTKDTRTLSDIVKEMPKGGDISLTVGVTQKLDVKYEKVNFSVAGSDPNESFPTMATIATPTNSLESSGKHLKKSIKRVLSCASMDNARPALQAILMKFDNGTVRFVATDGFRMGQLMVMKQDDKTSGEYIVPYHFLSQIAKILEDSATYKVEFTEVMVSITGGNIKANAALVEGKFPDYKQIVPPTQNANVARVPGMQLVKMYRTISTIKPLWIGMKAGGSGLELVSQELDETGSSLGTVPCNGIVGTACMNREYFSDALDALMPDAEEIEIITQSKDLQKLPVILRKFDVNECGDWFYIVMPMTPEVGEKGLEESFHRAKATRDAQIS